MRSLLAAAAFGLVASSCSAMPDSSVATPAPSASVITRPAANTQGDRPVVLRSLPEAGAFVTSFAPAWRYDGRQQKLDFPASTPASLEHAAPAGGLIAIERQTQTPGRYLVSTELAIRDRSNGPDRTVYRAPVMFYWSGWSPDGRYVLIWEVDFFSGSVDMDGRPLIVIDARTGMRFDLGRTLLHGTTAWSPPHTLAFAAGFGREVSQEKTLRLWAPETGIRDVSPIGTAALAPVWSASGQSLYFVSGPAGEYDPLPFFTGHAIGDRRISVYDLASGTTRSLAHEPGYVEEGVRPSRDGSRLLVLRRRTVEATSVPRDLDLRHTPRGLADRQPGRARHRARPHRERRLWVLRLVSRPERMGLVGVT